MKDENFTPPTCDMCGLEITTGLMCVGCPHGDKCAMFPHDADEKTKEFARSLKWAGK